MSFLISAVVSTVYEHGRNKEGKRPERQTCRGKDANGETVTLAVSQSSEVDWTELLERSLTDRMVSVSYAGKHNHTITVHGQTYTIPPRGRYLPLPILRSALGIPAPVKAVVASEPAPQTEATPARTSRRQTATASA